MKRARHALQRQHCRDEGDGTKRRTSRPPKVPSNQAVRPKGSRFTPQTSNTFLIDINKKLKVEKSRRSNNMSCQKFKILCLMSLWVDAMISSYSMFCTWLIYFKGYGLILYSYTLLYSVLDTMLLLICLIFLTALKKYVFQILSLRCTWNTNVCRRPLLGQIKSTFYSLASS